MKNRKKDCRIANAGDSRRGMENSNMREKEAKERERERERVRRKLRKNSENNFINRN